MIATLSHLDRLVPDCFQLDYSKNLTKLKCPIVYKLVLVLFDITGSLSTKDLYEQSKIS
jgi:hypothetical protein